jgi:hypothetical protein
MPSEVIRFDETANITSVVIKSIAISEIPKDEECITPLNVFEYTKKINSPRAKDTSKAASMSGTEKVAALSRKLKLKSCSSIVSSS